MQFVFYLETCDVDAILLLCYYGRFAPPFPMTVVAKRFEPRNKFSTAWPLEC